MTDRYAVIGNPIEHSKSPFIHQMFAQQTQQDMSYEAILLPSDDFVSGVKDLHSKGFQGMNVTVPFKFDAVKVCKTLSARARAAGAVNTLIRTKTGWQGDNTDGAGLVADLTALVGSLEKKHVLLLGAGGAASGVVKPLLDCKINHLTIVNRNIEKAMTLAKKAQHTRINGCGYDVVPNQPYDIIINATAASLAGDLPPLKEGWFSENTLAYDMMYAKQPTVFMKAATDFGAGRVCDGLGMLVEQAAEAFFLWRHIHPDTTIVRQALLT